MKQFCAGVLLVLLSTSAVWAYELEIIALKHRSAEEVLPIIRPLLLNADEVANGMNDQLILRTSPKTLAQIKQLLASIDTAPRRLKISVIQDVDRATLERMSELSGTVGIGAAGRISVPGSGDRDGLNVQVQRGGDRLNARIDNSDEKLRDHKTQALQVIEGGQAFVRVGQSVPVPQRQVIQHPWGTEVIDQTQYQEVSSGFYVRPRVRGDNVTLEISTQNDAVEAMHGRYPRENIQHASTTISGRVGEWLEMGGVSQQQDNERNTLTARGSSQVNEQRNVFIKVEEIVQ
jgi:hypothetical protein